MTFLLLEDGASALNPCNVLELTSGPVVKRKPCDSKVEPVKLALGSTGRFAITFEVQSRSPLRDPLIEARSADPGVPSAFAEVTISRSLSDRRLWWPVAAAAGAALVFAIAGAFATRDAVNRDPIVPPPKGFSRIWRWATAEILTAATWSFSGSWATSIAALGGVLGGVLGATGFFAEVFPGVSVGRFTGFSLVFGAVAVFGPIAYTALGRRDDTLSMSVGTVGGLLVASAAIVAAVAGQLMALGLLVQMSDASSTFQALCFLGLAMGGGIVIVYAARSAGWLSQQRPPPTPKAGEEATETVSSTPIRSPMASAMP